MIRRATPSERGAALLLALVILTLVSTIAAGMVWQQDRSVRVEAAERARAQAAWMLNGALDWARLILREDQRADRQRLRGANARPAVDALGETWANPLEEARLSSFLAADQNNSTDVALEVFLSGSIVDAQSRWNLRNLIGADGKPDPGAQQVLQRLADEAGAPSDTATRLATALLAAWLPADEEAARIAPLAPSDYTELRWLGIEPETLDKLEPFVTLLPVRTPVNVNTASSEVLAAVIGGGIDLGSAERIVQTRKRQDLGALQSLQDVEALLPEGIAKPKPDELSVTTRFFEVRGRLRFDQRVLEERSLVERRDNDVIVLWRRRTSLVAG